jgi:hypothetical protein
MTLGRTDAPISEVDGDLLGSASYARALSKFIRDCETPLTIGVQGEWGSGKTSIMRMIERDLNPPNDDKQQEKPKGRERPREPRTFLLHWFDAWQYGALGDDDFLGLQLVTDLTTSLAKQMENNPIALRILGRLYRSIKAISASAVAGAASSLSAGIIDRDVVQSTLSDERPPPRLADLRTTFSQLVEQYCIQTGNQQARIVVFVDDLDRIRPSRAVALLEVLKNFLEVPHCVFVIACDKTVVREGVRDRLGIVDDVKFDAFFDKLFQVPFQMPIGGYSNAAFIRGYIHELLARRVKKFKKTVTDYAVAVSSRVSRALEVAIGNNPRALKRFFNIADLMFCLDDERIAQDVQKPQDDETPVTSWDDAVYASSFLVVVALQSRWPSIAAYMANLATFESFDRALNTLLDPDNEEKGDQFDAEMDLLLQGLAPRREGWRQSDEIQAVSRFAEALVTAIDRQPDQRIDEQEFAVLSNWLERLVSSGMGGEQTFQTGVFRFRDAILKIDPKAGDAILGIIRRLDAKYAGDPRFGVVRSDQKYYIRLNSGSRQISPFTIYLKGSNQILARLNLGPTKAESLSIPVLSKIGSDFVTRTKAFGACWQPHGEGYRLDLIASRMSHANVSGFLRELFTLYDACAAAFEQKEAEERRASQLAPEHARPPDLDLSVDL